MSTEQPTLLTGPRVLFALFASLAFGLLWTAGEFWLAPTHAPLLAQPYMLTALAEMNKPVKP